MRNRMPHLGKLYLKKAKLHIMMYLACDISCFGVKSVENV